MKSKVGAVWYVEWCPEMASRAGHLLCCQSFENLTVCNDKCLNSSGNYVEK
jgi:hypothetical protein